MNLNEKLLTNSRSITSIEFHKICFATLYHNKNEFKAKIDPNMNDFQEGD